MVKNKISLLILFAVLTLKLNAATFSLTPGYEKAYLEILKLRFENASSLLGEERKKDHDNLAYLYLDAYTGFLKLILSEEDTYYISLLSDKPSRIKKLQSLDSSNPWRLYSQAQINLQSCIAEVKAGEYVKAAVDLKKAYNQFEENNRRFPGFIPNKAGLGLMHILIGSVPDSYAWITGALGMEGSLKKGQDELWKAMKTSLNDNHYPYLYQECLFLSAFVSFNFSTTNSFEKDLVHLLETDRIKNDLKHSPLLIYAIATFFSHNGMNDKAIALLTSRPTDKSYFKFHYLDYLTGVALLNKLDSRSRFYFLRYVTNYNGKSFLKSAYQRIAWSYLIEGDKDSYALYISRVPHFGINLMENDKEAVKEYDRGLPPNDRLLKARLLFDGGYYVRAEALLNGYDKQAITASEKLELIYRKARINHKLSNFSKAKLYYLESYNTGKKVNSYHAANSLLNLGNIYENDNMPKEALWCYKECLRLNFDEYRSSIQQKAKAGINRLTR